MTLGPQSPVSERATDEATKLRAKAEELRLAATAATTTTIRWGYIEMAAHYDAMADRLLKP